MDVNFIVQVGALGLLAYVMYWGAGLFNKVADKMFEAFNKLVAQMDKLDNRMTQENAAIRNDVSQLRSDVTKLMAEQKLEQAKHMARVEHALEQVEEKDS
jgi:hypothetical protein